MRVSQTRRPAGDDAGDVAPLSPEEEMEVAGLCAKAPPKPGVGATAEGQRSPSTREIWDEHLSLMESLQKEFGVLLIPRQYS